MEWSFNGGHLPPHLLLNGNLTIPSVRNNKTYEGTYSCTARSRAGLLTIGVVLTVHGKLFNGGSRGSNLPLSLPFNTGFHPVFVGSLHFALFGWRNITQCCLIFFPILLLPPPWYSRFPPSFRASLTLFAPLPPGFPPPVPLHLMEKPHQRYM